MGRCFELHGCSVLKAKARSLQSSACWKNSCGHRVTPRRRPYLQLLKSLKCHMPPKRHRPLSPPHVAFCFAASGPTFTPTGSHLTGVTLLKFPRLQGPLSAILLSKRFVIDRIQLDKQLNHARPGHRGSRLKPRIIESFTTSKAPRAFFCLFSQGNLSRVNSIKRLSR